MAKKFKYVSCGECDSCVLEGPEHCYNMIMVPVASKPRKVKDDAWRREAANQAGMGLGVQAYNDAMGY